MARILIVDDEQSIRRALKDILEMEKYQVDEASDGLDCLVKLKQNAYGNNYLGYQDAENGWNGSVG